MVTLKTYRPEVRAPRRSPTPKRKPARLSSEVAKYVSRSQRQRKPKSR